MAMLLASSNWVVGLCLSGVLILYAYRMPREESMMLEAFGEEYRGYMKTTGRLLPKLNR
jgi:protein-S-isoprenylcysteine O-methyltransferase Ste14